MYAAVCGLAGALISGAFVAEALGEGWWRLIVSAGLGSFSTAWLVWRLGARLLSRGGRATGAGLGILTAVVSHYSSWYVLLVASWCCAVLVGGCRGSLGEAPVDPVHALAGAGGLALWSLILAGPLSLPTGAVIGALCIRRSPT
jgi:hypothetical protein